MNALSFLAFIVRLQWLDRIATSAFLVGITLQTGIFALAVFETSTGPAHALELAVRGGIFSAVGILVFSSMSAITNEVDLGTLENAVLGGLPFSRLVALRAAATALISSPVIVVPFAAAVLRWPELLSRPAVYLRGFEVYVLSASLGYQLAWILNSFPSPRAALPWARYLILLVGMNLLPFEGMRALSLVFPTGWLLAGNSAGFWICAAAWTLFVRVALEERVVEGFERRLCDPRRR